MDVNEKRHESYGIVSICRGNCSKGIPLFGSPIKHSNIITIEVRKAYSQERHGSEYIFQDGRAPLISIDLSPAQFADLITTPNTSGTACTLRYVEGRNMENPPDPDSIQLKAESNMRETQDAIIQRIVALEQKLAESNIGKRIKDDILHDIKTIKSHATSNIPFVVDQFNREIGRVVTAAKAEIEAAVHHKITVLGNQALVQQVGNGGAVIEHNSIIEIE